MSFPCNNPCVVCPPSVGGGVGPVDPANPFINLSSETPDVDNFIGRRYSIGLPPLGSTWYAVGCVGFCLSDESQEAADLCAAQQAVLCQSGNWPEIVPGVVPGTLVPEDRTVYSNNPQQCSFTCPDGSVYIFTVAAGIFSSVANQETADLMAYSYACNKAVENHMCLGTLTPVRTCASSTYEGTVYASTSNIPVSFTMVTPLPDGLLLQQTEIYAFIHGTPTTPGDYAFTIRATDSLGHSVDKVLNLSVFGVSTDSPLTDANINTAYSEILQYAGTPSGTVTWSLTAGALPSGVTLDSATGELSGTPTESGTYLMTFQVSDGVLSCSKSLSLTVVSGCPYDNMVFIDDPDQAPPFATGNASYDFTNAGNTLTIRALATCDVGPVCGASFVAKRATLVYAGPGPLNSNLEVTITDVEAGAPGSVVNIYYDDGMGEVFLAGGTGLEDVGNPVNYPFVVPGAGTIIVRPASSATGQLVGVIEGNGISATLTCT